MQQLAAIGRAGEETGTKIGHGARAGSQHLGELEKLSNEIRGGFERMHEALSHFTSMLPSAEGMLGRLREAAGDFNGVLAAMAAATIGVVGGMAALAESAGKNLAELEHASQAVGTTVENYGKLQFVLQQTGASAEASRRGLTIINQLINQIGVESDKTQKNISSATEAYNKAMNDASDRLELAMTRLRFSSRSGQSYLLAQTEAQMTYNETVEKAREAYNKAGQGLDQMQVKAQIASAEIRKLGVALTPGEDPFKAFMDISEAISHLGTASERAQASVAIFGRRFGGQFVEAMSKGRAEIERMGHEAERLGLIFTEADTAIGKAMEESSLKLSAVFGALRTRIGEAFIPLFSSINEALAELFGGSSHSIVAAAQSLSNALKPIFDDIANALRGDGEKVHSQFILVMVDGFRFLGEAIRAFATVVTDLLGVVMQTFDQLATAYNDVFGTKLTGADLVGFVVALRGLITVLALARTAFLLLNAAMGPWGLAIAAVSIAVMELAKHWDEVKRAVTDAWEAIQRTLGLSAAAPAAATGGSEPAAVAAHHAAGGQIHGPGTGTSDSIPAWVSNGEYIVNAAATRVFLPLLDAINGMRNPFAGLRGIGLAAPIGGPMPRFAEGGRVSVAPGYGSPLGSYGRVSLELHLAGQTYLASTDEATANGLRRAAHSAGVRSAGKKPSWATS